MPLQWLPTLVYMSFLMWCSTLTLKCPLLMLRIRSISNPFHSSLSPLYTPLLASSPTSPVSEDVSILCLNDSEDDELSKLGSPLMEAEVEANGQFGIVLVHGFGGGVFSWRKVMGTMAWKIGCAIAAFDRPGWGLTSRPRQKDWEDNQLSNPYKIDNQVDLLLSFCLEMGFSSVVLVGYDDGGLLALKAAQKVQLSANSMNLEIKGVILLNTGFSRELVPAFARILLRTSLGKKHLVRPLLRTEVTQVVNRRAWYNEVKLTTEVLALYKAPLYVEGWDEALHEIGKLSYETVLSPNDAALMQKVIEALPILVIAGAEDALVPLKSVQTMASKFVNSMSNYSSMDGILYCKTHFEQLFKEFGNLLLLGYYLLRFPAELHGCYHPIIFRSYTTDLQHQQVFLKDTDE